MWKKIAIFVLFLIVLLSWGFVYLYDPQQCEIGETLGSNETKDYISIERFLIAADSLETRYSAFPELNETVSSDEFFQIMTGELFNIFVVETVLNRNREQLFIIDEEIQKLSINGVDFLGFYPWTSVGSKFALKRDLSMSLTVGLLFLRERYELNAKMESTLDPSIFLKFLDQYASGRGASLADVWISCLIKAEIIRCNKQKKHCDVYNHEEVNLHWESIKTNMKTALLNEFLFFPYAEKMLLHGNFLYKKNETKRQYLRFIKTSIAAIDSGNFSEVERLCREIESSEKTWFNFMDPNKNGKRLLRALNFNFKNFYEIMKSSCFYDPAEKFLQDTCHFIAPDKRSHETD